MIKRFNRPESIPINKFGCNGKVHSKNMLFGQKIINQSREKNHSSNNEP